jgi:hypothetical protein
LHSIAPINEIHRGQLISLCETILSGNPQVIVIKSLSNYAHNRLTHSPPRVIFHSLAQATTQGQEQENKMSKVMTNDKDLINRVARIYSLTNDATATDTKLARIILSEYYGVNTFFLVNENDYSSGLNMDSVQIFIDNMKQVKKAINGEL